LAKKTAYPEWVVTASQQAMHDDFRKFLWYIWKHLGLPPPTEIQYDIALYLQGGPRRLIIEAFRGVGKSWITAAFVLWVLYRDPQKRILVVSASKERADAFSIFVKRLIAEIDILQFLKPRGDQRDSNIAFDVGPSKPDQAPSVKSVGITGQITGSRADIIIPDDVEVPGNCMTEDQREKLANLVKEFDSVVKPGGRIMYLGTPQTAQSLYNTLQSRGYQTRVWPARYTTGVRNDEAGEVDEYHGTLAPYILDKLIANPELLGKTTDPARFSEEDLLERETSYGRSGFALQFMLNTSLSDANRYPLKTRDLIVMDLDKKIAPVQLTWASGHQQALSDVPNVGLNGDRCHGPLYKSEAFVPYQGAAMIIDPHGRGADECAYAVTKMLNGLIFVTAWGGIRGDGFSEQTLTALALIAKEHAVNEIVPEVNFGDGMFNALLAAVLKKHYPCTIVDDHRVTGQKELRIIDKMEPALNRHIVVMDKSVAIANAQPDATGSHAFSGLYQMTHITRDRGALRHDDRIDVLAEAIGYWVTRLEADNSDSERKHEADQRAKALADFAKAAGVKLNYSRFKNYVQQPGDRRRPTRSTASLLRGRS
jgi:hypothetical protein